MYIDRQKLLQIYLQNNPSTNKKLLLNKEIIENNLSEILDSLQIKNWHLFVINYTLIQCAFLHKSISMQQYDYLYKNAINDPSKIWLLKVKDFTPKNIWDIAQKWYQEKTWNSYYLEILKETLTKQCEISPKNTPTTFEKFISNNTVHFSAEIISKKKNPHIDNKKIHSSNEIITNNEKTDPSIETLSRKINNNTDISIKKMFKHYYIEEELGRGGMGIVYKALDTRLERHIALKVIIGTHGIQSNELQRFMLEVKSMAKVNHEGIVRLLDVGESPFPYYTMEYVEGFSLSTYIKKKNINNKEIATMMSKIAIAIENIHQLDIVHRDIKPANIMITHNLQPKVMDFGLVKTKESELSKAGEILGTPLYMSPEQVNNDQVGKESDIYSLGATLYEILCGKPPFHGNSFVNIADQIYNNDPISPRKLNPEIATDLESICLKCLEKDKKKRYKTAQDLSDDFQNFLHHRTLIAKPPNVFEKSMKWCYRHQLLTLCCLMMIIVITISFSFFYEKWQNSLRITNINNSLRQTNEKLIQVKKEKEQALYSSQKSLVVAHAKMAEYQTITKNFNQALKEVKQAFLLLDYITKEKDFFLKKEIMLDANYKIIPNLVKKIQSISLPSPNARLIEHGESIVLRHNGNIYRQNIQKTSKKIKIHTKSLISNIKNSNASFTSRNIVAWNEKNYYIFAPNKKKTVNLGAKQNIFHISIDKNGEWCAIKRMSDVVILHVPSRTTQIMESKFRNSHRAKVAFSPDAKYLAGQLGARLYIWKRHNKKFEEMHSLITMGTKVIISMVFSPDNKWLVYGDVIGNVYMTNVFNKNTTKIKSHTQKILSICFHPSGRIFATSSIDGSICLWDAVTTSLISRIVTNQNNYQICFSRDGNTLISLSKKNNSGFYTVWNTEPLLQEHLFVKLDYARILYALQKSLPTLESLFSKPIKMSHLGNLVAVTYGSVLSLWDLKKRTNHIFSQKNSFLQKKNIKDFNFSPDEKWLAIIYDNDICSLIETKAKKEILQFSCQKMSQIFFLPDNKHIILKKGRKIFFFNIAKKDIVDNYTYSAGIRAMTVHNKKNYIVTCDKHSIIKILEKNNKSKIIDTFKLDGQFATLLSYSNTRNYIAAYSKASKELSIYQKTKSWSLLQKLVLKEKVINIIFSPNEKEIALSTFSKILIYNLELNKTVEIFNGYFKMGLASVNTSWKYILFPAPNAGIAIFKMPSKHNEDILNE